MGYRIIYTPEQSKKYPRKRKKLDIIHWYAAIILMIVILLLVGNPVVRTGLKRIMLPGDPIQTETAFVKMIEHIREGATVSDSITAFCLEILNAAERPD